MSDMQASKLESAIRQAVTATIKEVGLGTLKSTSMFLSNERPRLRKAA